MSRTPSDVFREYARHEAERRSPLMVGLLEGAADDWDAGGVTADVLAPYADEPPGSAVPLRFAAALHRLVLAGRAVELAAHYATVGGSAPAEHPWPAARRVLERWAAEVRKLTSGSTAPSPSPAPRGCPSREPPRDGVWRLSYEPDPGSNPRGVPLRLHGPGTDPAGDVLAYGTGHGPPMSAPA